MSSYTGLKQSFTPGTPPGGDNAQYLFGLSFKVTASGKQLDGWWWYCDITNGQDNHAEDFGLWQVTGSGTGSYVTGSKVTSGTFVQGWNFVACNTPITLTSGQEYRAVKTVNKSNVSSTTYSHTANFFSSGSGNPGAVNGPLTIFAAPGGTTPEPSGDGQMVFSTSNPSTDVTDPAGYPTGTFSAGWYGLDVQVSDIPTSFRLMDGASGRPGTGSSTMTPPSAVTSYSGNFQAGCAFIVNKPGMWFEGFWWFCPTGGDTGPQKFCLYAISGSQVNTSAPVLIPAATITSGTLTANAWNFIQPSNLIPLSVGHLTSEFGGGGGVYIATTAWTAVNGFPDTNNAFGSGDPYSNGIANGPLETFGYFGGSTRQNPVYASTTGPTSGQLFGTAQHDPALGCPVATDGGYDNFWIDVQVTDVAPASYGDINRLYPNRYDTNDATTNDASVGYVVATEVTLSAPAVAKKIWYYSPAGTSQLATRASLWTITGVSSGTEVIAITSPSWKTPSGASMTAGAGWCYTDAGSVKLSAGSYKVSVFNSNATPDGWSAKDASSAYWDTGEGANGAGFGVLTAPKLSAASLANKYNGSNPGGTPPYSAGTTQVGQSTFAQTGATAGSNAYPSLYVDALAQNYWLDFEVLPVVTGTGSIRMHKMGESATGKEKIAGTGSIRMHKMGLHGSNYPVDYVLWDASPAGLPIGSQNFGAPTSLATLFKVTQSGWYLKGYRFWCLDFSQDSSDVRFATWRTTGVGTGAVLSGSQQTAPELTVSLTDGNDVFLDTPVALTANQAYAAVVGDATFGPFTDSYFAAGHTGASGITKGPLVAFSDQSASAPDPGGNHQGLFQQTSSDPTAAFPATAFDSSNFWISPIISNDSSGLSVSYESTDGNGVDTYSVTAQENNTASIGALPMRVLKPSAPSSSYPHGFLIMLPVDPGQDTTFGDSIGTAVSLGAHNTYNLTIIQPGYATHPWYGDNPDDASTKQETFLLDILTWIKAHLATTGTEPVYLIGFSSSGLGGQGLQFRHPTLFQATASWDSPFSMTDYDGTDPNGAVGGESASVYGTTGNFTSNYELSSGNLTTWKTPFTAQNRIWIGGYAAFQQDVIDYDAKLTTAGILHTLGSMTSVTHAWHNAWVAEALSVIVIPKDTGTGSIRMHKMGITSTGKEKIAGTGSIRMHKMGLTGSGTETFTVSGTGSIRMHKMGITSTGKEKIAGTGAVRMHKMGLSGFAVEPIFGVGTIRMHKMKLSGAGRTAAYSGTGSIRMHKMGLHGVSHGHNYASQLFIFNPA